MSCTIQIFCVVLMISPFCKLPDKGRSHLGGIFSVKDIAPVKIAILKRSRTVMEDVSSTTREEGGLSKPTGSDFWLLFVTS